VHVKLPQSAFTGRFPVSDLQLCAHGGYCRANIPQLLTFCVTLRSTRRHIPEDCTLHSHRRENLKPYPIDVCNSVLYDSGNLIFQILFRRISSVSYINVCRLLALSISYVTIQSSSPQKFIVLTLRPCVVKALRGVQWVREHKIGLALWRITEISVFSCM
jgi:hypothetical protein